MKIIRSRKNKQTNRGTCVFVCVFADAKGGENEDSKHWKIQNLYEKQILHEHRKRYIFILALFLKCMLTSCVS